MKAKLQIVLVGAGRLATNLGMALKGAGHEVTCVYSRTEASASTLAGRLGTDWTTSLSELPRGMGLYIVSVADNALQEVIGGLPDMGDSLVVHTAGSMPISLFEGKTKHFGVFYPMQTFSKDIPADFRKIPCFIEASDESSLAVLKGLADLLSDQVMVLSSEGRKYLHLSAVMASNFTNHCYAMAWRMTQKYDIPFQVLHSLIDETARKAKGGNPIACQTGPAVRNDVNVMKDHVLLLADEPETAELYRLMSLDIMKYAKLKYD